jgi:hypothetical protein
MYMSSLLSPSRGRSLSTVILAALLLASPLAVAQAAAAAKPEPDVLVFTNGDQLTGKLERGAGDSIVFNSDMAGEITVPLSKVKELRSGASFAVLRKDVPITRVKVEPGPIKTSDDNVVVTRSNAAPETIPDKELAYIIDADTYKKEVSGHHSIRDGWNGSIIGGATLVQATQYGETFTAGVAVTRTIPTVPWLPPRNRTIFGLIETYGKLTQPVIPQTTPPSPDTVAKTSIFHAGVEQDQYFNPHIYALATAAFDHNYSQGLDLQQLYGGGIGWQVVNTPVQQFSITGSIHYERQSFQIASNNENLIGATIGENYLRNLPHKLVFTEFANYLPAFNVASAYSATFGAGLALPVYHRFSTSFSVADSYLNNPSPGYLKNSFQFVAGVTYTLH